MPPTIHKLLAHGADIAYLSVVTLGEIGEDSGESSHKGYRFDRTHRTRKCNRTKTIYDLFKKSWCKSDPDISSYDEIQKPRSEIPSEPLALLDVSEEEKNELKLVSFEFDEDEMETRDEEEEIEMEHWDSVSSTDEEH